MKSTGPSPIQIIIKLALQWWWLLAISVALGGGTGYFIRAKQPDVYYARASVLFGTSFTSTQTVSSLQELNDMISIYSGLVRQPIILTPVIEKLNLNMSVDELNRHMTVTEVEKLPLLNISIASTDAASAANIANAVAQEMIDQSPTEHVSDAMKFRNQQLSDLSAQINNLKAQYDKAVAAGANLTSSYDIAQNFQEQTNTLATMRELQQLYANMGQSAGDQGNLVMSIFEPAAASTAFVVSSSIVSVLLSAAAGLILAIVTIILIWFFDDRLQWNDDLERVEDINVIGPLGLIPRNKLPLYADNMPDTIEVEVLRQLRAKLVLATNNAQPKVVVLTSYDSGDGKSVTSANLALVTAESGLRTLLIDGDMRKGNLHEFFGLPNVMGISDILTGRDDLNLLLSRALLDSNIDNLTLLTAGRATSNPAALLGRPRFGELIQILRGQFDAIVVDSVPTIGGPDAAFLAEHSDGVVIVVHAQRTTRRKLHLTVQSLQQGANSKVNIYGVVFNRIALQLTSTYHQPYYRRNLAINRDTLNKEMITASKHPGFSGRNTNVIVDPNGIRLYSVAAASVQLGISKETLQEWVNSGHIKSEKQSRRSWISETEISNFLDRLPRHEIPVDPKVSQSQTPRKNTTGKLSSGKLRDLMGGRDALLASARDNDPKSDDDISLS